VVPEAERLVEELEARLAPLEVALAEAWWETSTRASPEANERRERVELERRAVLADPDAFAAVREGRNQADLDPLVRRRLDVLHDAMAPNQIPEDLRRRLVALEVEVESDFNTHRGTIDGERVDDNRLREILRTSDDSEDRRGAWEASKQVGTVVADRVRELATLRNEAARALGYRDHFALALATSEMDEARLSATLDEVDRVTATLFAGWKAGLDATLADRYGCQAEDLRPWHLDDPFFQDAPITAGVDLDPYFEDTDVESVTLRTYDELGLDLRPVFERSDLYPREGKSQHAFCVDIDRQGDVRVLCNIEPTERWVETMLHEFGHATYDRELDPALPFLLRTAAHPLTTEGVAMLFGRLARDPEWLRTVAALSSYDVESLAPRLAAGRLADLLVFARWVLVMTSFERGLYADPAADHERRWWDLVERYQRVRRPDRGDRAAWASKVHLTVAPVYYHSYLYGELVASQLSATLDERAGGLVGHSEAGRYLTERLFRPGASRRWDHLIEAATGSPLSPAAFAAQLGG
jgi:peptidyl-dipeptidase A